MKRRVSASANGKGNLDGRRSTPASEARFWTASRTNLKRAAIYLHVCLKDKTEVNLTLSSRLVIEEAVLTDMSSGNSKPIKEYVSYEG